MLRVLYLFENHAEDFRVWSAPAGSTVRRGCQFVRSNSLLWAHVSYIAPRALHDTSRGEIQCI